MKIIFPTASTDVNNSFALPAHLYTDPAIFEVEKEAIFRKEWLPVARVDQLANPGDYLTYDLFGDEIAIVRDQNGAINAFSNICLHRACPILSGHGHTDSNVITCPYHKWSYELTGKLRGAPQMMNATGFIAHDLQLPKVNVEQWQGWIFINLDPDAKPLAPQLSELNDYLSPWNFADLKLVHTLSFDSPWNWKIMVDNFLESYHHAGTHPETLHALYPAQGTYGEKVQGNYILLENPSIDAETIPYFWAGCIMPFTLFALVRDQGKTNATWYQMFIDDVGHFRLDIHILANDAIANDEQAVQSLVDVITRIHLEDIPVCEGVWKGVNSRFYQPGRLSHLEECLWQFQNYLREKLD